MVGAISGAVSPWESFGVFGAKDPAVVSAMGSAWAADATAQGSTLEDALSPAKSKIDPALPGMNDILRKDLNGVCQTCQNRRYQDGSDDPSVSFQSPTHIDPDAAASVVAGHEMEHVVNERVQAEQEDREVVSQSVVLHSAICPECGRTYIAGGTTTTTTAGKTNNNPEELLASFGVGTASGGEAGQSMNIPA